MISTVFIKFFTIFIKSVLLFLMSGYLFVGLSETFFKSVVFPFCMDILSREELVQKQRIFLKKIEKGSLFIHPTDTVYGIGCNALNDEAVKKIREIKKSSMPFSIIVPNIDWIYENCVVTPNVEKWIKNLPGPVTLILKLKNKNAVSRHVNLDLETIGVRIPNHWISDLVNKLGYPVVSTIIMNEDQTILVSPENLHHDVVPHVDFAINEGELSNNRSRIINLSEIEQLA